MREATWCPGRRSPATPAPRREGRCSTRVQRLEAALEQLATAQARTQEQLLLLTQRVETLAAAVERLVQRVDRLDDRTAWLVGEALEARYHRRAALLHRAPGTLVMPAVTGQQILPDAQQEADRAGVWRVLDGRATPPTGPSRSAGG